MCKAQMSMKSDSLLCTGGAELLVCVICALFSRA